MPHTHGYALETLADLTDELTDVLRRIRAESEHLDCPDTGDCELIDNDRSDLDVMLTRLDTEAANVRRLVDLGVYRAADTRGRDETADRVRGQLAAPAA